MRTLRRKLRRDLRRQAGQALAIAVTLFLGAALFAASYDGYRNLTASYARVFQVTRAADLYVQGGDVRRFSEQARGMAGVRAVVVRTVADVPLRIGASKLAGRVVGVPGGGGTSVNRLLVDEGRGLSAGAPDAVVAERHLASDFHLNPGDRIGVLGRSGWAALPIRGVVTSPEYLWPAQSRQNVLPPPRTFGVVFAAEPLAERIAGTGPDEALVRYTASAPATLTPRLERLAARLGGVTTTRADQASNATLQTDIEGFRELAIMFPILFLGAATLASGVLLSRRVRAERALIGALRANGASRGQIVRHYLGYGVVLGVAGGVAGAAVGAVAAGAITRVYTQELSIPLAVTSVRPGTAVLACCFGILVGAASAAVPALAAARVAPAEAMRGAVPAGGAGRSLVERLVPPARRLPVRYRHVLRSIGRNRRRSLSTILGVVLAEILILVGWGMLDTTQILVARQFGRVDRQDATLQLRGPVSAAAVGRIRAVAGVAAAEPAARTPVALATAKGRYGTDLVAFEPGTRMHGFPHPAQITSGLVLGSALRGLLGVGVGDRVQVVLASGRRFTAPVSGFVTEPLGTYAYTGLPLAAALTAGAVSPDEVLVRFSPGADRAATLRRLEHLPLVASVSDTRALVREFNRFLGFFYAFVGVMLLFAAALAFAIMFTTQSANMQERAVEITTLRASGVDYPSVARLIRAENLILTVAGVVVGLPIAYLVAQQFMSAYTSDLFQFDLALKARTPILAALSLIVVAVVSELPGLRALRRIDVATVARTRSG